MVIGEVQRRERATKAKGSCVIGTGSLFGGGMVSEMNSLAIVADRSLPATGSFEQRDAVISRRVRRHQAPVALVLGAGADSQVLPRVVETVPVNVVNDHTRCYTCDDKVHAPALSPSIRSRRNLLTTNRVEVLTVSHDMPFVLQEDRRVFGIYEGEHAGELAAMQGNAYDCTHGGLTSIIVPSAMLQHGAGVSCVSPDYTKSPESSSYFAHVKGL